jgi:predicted RNA-binding Zn-ribbon protein involved in translation (DUF1610 family)
MMQVQQYRAQLDKTSKKFNCPNCGKKRFVRCIDNASGDYLPDEYGRCDRENGCGYELSWTEFYKGSGEKQKPLIGSMRTEEIKPVEYLPIEYLEAIVPETFYRKNNFFLFLQKRYTDRIARDAFRNYCLGTSSYWKGAVVFPQLDTEGNLRQIKIMLHDPSTGKRIKEGEKVERFDRTTKQYLAVTTENPCSIIYGRFLNESTKGLNLEQTFFGAHLLTEYPEKPVCIVESEKTAVISSIHLPQFNWLATGGASGCKWREYNTYQVLKNHSVTFFPDYGIFNIKSGKTCFDEWRERAERISEALSSKIRVSDSLEKYFIDQQREDQDLADIFLNNIDSTGLVLTENDYPVCWDYKY